MTAVAACSGSQEQESGSLQLTASSAQALSAADITRVNVVVTGSNITHTISQDLVLSGTGLWSGVINRIPVGTDTQFHADAYDRFGVIQYTGEAKPVTITKNNTTAVTIILQQVNKPPPFANVAPIIDALVASKTDVSPLDTIQLGVNAHDPNEGDVLSYSWSAQCNTPTTSSFAASSQATTAWTAPNDEGDCMITIAVSDQKQATVSASFVIRVRTANGRGSALINAFLNTWPEVDGLVATPAVVNVGQTTRLQLAVHDNDNDKLSFQWTTDCRGTFDNANAQVPSFTLMGLASPNVAGDRICTFECAISDGRGGTNTATFGIHTGTLATPNVAPVIDSAFQTAVGYTEGSRVSFRVVAHDPEGGPISFQWSATSGTLGAPSSSETDSSIVWTAPPSFAQGATADITVTVTDAQGEATTELFHLTGTVTNQCVVGQGFEDQYALESQAILSLTRTPGQSFTVGRDGMLTGVEVAVSRCDSLPATGQLQALLFDQSGNSYKGGIDISAVRASCASSLDTSYLTTFTFNACLPVALGSTFRIQLQANGISSNTCTGPGTCSMDGTACGTGLPPCPQVDIRVGTAQPIYTGGTAYTGSTPDASRDLLFRSLMQ
jgi:hypothetical protein